MSTLYREPPIDASYQVSDHLAKRFQRRRIFKISQSETRVISLLTEKNIFFRYHSIRNKNSMWWPCLLTDQDEISTLYRGPSIDASYQVSVHLAKRFQRRRLKKNRPIRNKNCLWWPCLLMDRDKMSNLDRGPTIYASY
jgi:hypothetical protein